MPSSADWWDTWLDEHGRDSEEEKAFVGYLSTQGIAHTSPPADLETAYGTFKEFMQRSAETPSAEAGDAPPPAQLASQPRSHTANPGLDKPQEDATRVEDAATPDDKAPRRR